MTDIPARPLYFDCDTGIDDALALAYLLASPEVALLDIGTVSGNTDAATAARNTQGLLALAGREEVPVAVGRHDFLARPYDGGAPHVHGANGVGDVLLPEPAGAPLEGVGVLHAVHRIGEGLPLQHMRGCARLGHAAVEAVVCSRHMRGEPCPCAAAVCSMRCSPDMRG